VATGDASVVWLAHDEVLGKDISLHFLPPQVRADTRALEEIRKEVKRNRQLIHPNILRVHDFIEEPEFSAVAMDSFEGEALASLLKLRGVIEPGVIQPWIAPLCQTLEDAHKINLTHRDLAPANIYLGADGKLLLSNFGISRCIQDALGRVNRGSNPRLAYMSPQLAEGQAPTRGDDVYSLGMLLFELLTGELPFNGGDVISQIRRVAAPRVSARLASGRKNVELPASWDETIAAALRKDASQRPANATDFATRLEAVPVKEIKATEVAVAQKTDAAMKPAETSQKAGQIAAVSAAAALPMELGLEPKPAENKAAQPTDPAIANGKPASEPPGRKAVDILRERAAELKRNQSGQSGTTPVPASAEAKKENGTAREESKATPPPPPVSKSPAKKEDATDIYPNLYPQRSRLPALGLAAGIALAAVGVGGFLLNESKKQADPTTEEPDIATTEQSYGSEIRSVNNQGTLPSAEMAAETVIPNNQPEPPSAPSVKAEPPPNPTVESIPPAKAVVSAPPVEAIAPVPPKPEPAKDEMLFAARKPATPTPAPKAATPASPTEPAPTEQTLAEKQAAVEKLKQAIQASEQAHQDLVKQQQQAESAAADIQKALEQKSKELTPLKKAADDLAKTRKLKEEAQKAADAEAQRAQQVAAEKARLAEDAKKALADLDAQNKEKLSAQEKADAELVALQKTLTEKQQAAAAVTRAVADTTAARQQQLAAVKQAEQEAEQTKLLVAKAMAAETARVAREEAEKVRLEKAKEREKIESEITAMRKMFEEKMKVLEDAQKAISEAEAKTKDTDAVQKKAEEEALKMLNKGAAPGGGKPAAAEKAPAPTPPPAPSAGSLIPSDNPLAQATTAPVVPAAPPAPTPPAPAPAAPAATLAMKTDPAKLTTPSAEPTVEKPAQGTGLLENSLGMKFAPVGDALFAIWQTRVKDFEAFAKAVNLRSNAWKGPGFKQAPDHPVVNVTWQEAVAFCQWLTTKERKDGTLPANMIYRLPSDQEWSKAVGLSEEAGKNPEARDMGVPDVYPWGNQWPPPAGAGNYTGEETGSDVAIKGYDDGFAWTSPVGSFPPNKFGLYDIGGNVWQWVMDSWNGESKHKVLRGASWYNGALKLSLLSSCRVHAAPDSSTDNYGFRVVRAPDTGKAGR
jgi:serine/threonine protein kinase